MTLTCGTRIGPYEIVAPLGAGGMGEVYRARDPRLERDVAIKVLYRELGDRRRFELEARAASSLNHANILTIYDIGEEDGAPYIVSELLDGDSLRVLLREGALAVRTVLDIGVQIAAGLAAAHARGIVHRDLKPENIMVLRNGCVKIVDFGLAKQPDADGCDEITRTSRGLLVGTIPYMSPEQVQGHAVDIRSDQFSLGTILFEMAAGVHPFLGTDRVDTMSAIARREPSPAGALNSSLPPLRWLIERCLAKEAAQRFTSTADLCAQLKDIRDHISEVVSSESAATPIPARASEGKSRSWWLWTLAAALVAVTAFTFGALLMERLRVAPVHHYTPFATEAADDNSPAWSHDGSTIAYTAVVKGIEQVFSRKLDRPVAAQITSSTTTCMWPFWSADDARVYYWSANSIWEVGAAGGEAREVVRDVQMGWPPAAISPDGATMAYFNTGALHTVRLMRMADGASHTYDRRPFPERFRLTGGMRFSTDGRKLLVWLISELDHGTELWILPFPDGVPQKMNLSLIHGYRPLTASWMNDNRHVAVATETAPGNGSHIYILDTESGEATHLTEGTSEESAPAVSPDGDRLAFASGRSHSDLMEASIDGGRVAPLLATTRRQQSADWSPTGRQYVYVTEANGPPEIWLRSLEEGWARPVVQESEDGTLQYAIPRLSPDGEKVAYVRVGVNHCIFITNLSGGQAVRLEQVSRDQHSPAWSPDGKWIAYTRYLSGQWEIAKTPSGGGGLPVRVAAGGSALTQIEWSPQGTLWFLEGQDLFRVADTGGVAVAVAQGIAAFMLRKDGEAVYLIRQERERGWQLTTMSVASGVEGKPVPLALEMDATVQNARLNPDGKHFVLSVITWKRDIWILDGLKSRGARSLSMRGSAIRE